MARSRALLRHGRDFDAARPGGLRASARKRQARRGCFGDLARRERGRTQPAVDVVALDEALDRLASVDPQQSRVVELRFFAGLSVEETAEALGVSPATVKRDWATAKLWLYNELMAG
jgi:RNA polymerase sigma factor (sigma-70 family)